MVETRPFKLDRLAALPRRSLLQIESESGRRVLSPKRLTRSRGEPTTKQKKGTPCIHTFHLAFVCHSLEVGLVDRFSSPILLSLSPGLRCHQPLEQRTETWAMAIQLRAPMRSPASTAALTTRPPVVPLYLTTQTGPPIRPTVVKRSIATQPATTTRTSEERRVGTNETD